MADDERKILDGLKAEQELLHVQMAEQNQAIAEFEERLGETITEASIEREVQTVAELLTKAGHSDLVPALIHARGAFLRSQLALELFNDQLATRELLPNDVAESERLKQNLLQDQEQFERVLARVSAVLHSNQ